jgi:hypothetical protein
MYCAGKTLQRHGAGGVESEDMDGARLDKPQSCDTYLVNFIINAQQNVRYTLTFNNSVIK